MMSQWAFMLGGLLVWAAHFFMLYAFVSLLPGNDVARWLTLAATLAALAANGVLIWLASRGVLTGYGAWPQRFAVLGALVSILAVFWQALPAILV